MLGRFVALLLLVIASPVIVIVGILVFFVDGWPVIYRQQRVGYHGKRFFLYKFRTMVLHADQRKGKYQKLNESLGPVFKIWNDPRFTTVGKFLSHTGLDELPQLWNVVCGDMAFIGPRPFPVSEVQKLQPWMRARESILPGIISPAILTGKYHQNFDAWMRSDIVYAKQKNMRTDVVLSVRMVPFLLGLLLREVRGARAIRKGRMKLGILVAALVVIGLFLRLYHRDQAMYYMNDQGHLLIVAHEILASGHAPLAGPRISLDRASIAPFNYYLVSIFERIGSDPLVIASEYILLNLLAGFALGYYSFLLSGLGAGLWTLGAVMLSAAMVENGRSIWEPQPTFSFVVFYLLLTEIAFRKKNIWLYCVGIVFYVCSIALYPTPLLLLPFVFMRAISQLRSFGGKLRRHSFSASVFLVGGMLVAVFAPWVVNDFVVQQPTATSILNLITSFVSPIRMAYVLYANASTMVHDVFSFAVLLPYQLIGSFWVKLAVGVLAWLMASTLRRNTIIAGAKAFVANGYHWILLGFVAPVIIGMKMMPHRQLPFYPFVFIFLAWWMRRWIRDRNRIRRWLAFGVVSIFIIGNLTFWYATTIGNPRNDYVRANVVTRTIVQDMASRHLTASSIGAHYFRPDDQYDFFGAHLYYLLRLSVNYPVSFAPLGNELARGVTEDHKVAYLVCDGFIEPDDIPGCIRPFLLRWSMYSPVQKYTVSPTESVIVFERS